jgi:hypothetical protein
MSNPPEVRFIALALYKLSEELYSFVWGFIDPPRTGFMRGKGLSRENISVGLQSIFEEKTLKPAAFVTRQWDLLWD